MTRTTVVVVATAVAGAVVVLPLAVPGLRGPGRPSTTESERTTGLVQRPLDGLGGGVTIREVSQQTPFSMVALTGDDLTGTSAKVRAKRPDGSWGPWYESETEESDGSDSAASSARPTGPRGTEPVFVGRTTTVQIAVTRAPGATPTGSGPAPGALPAPGLGYVPVDVEHGLAPTVNAVLISPAQAPADPQWNLPTAALSPGQPPNIISRAQWGADESIRCGNPVYDDGVKAAVVHHTAGSNDYAPQDSAEIVRAIYAYHTRTLGWCDIAYNALVDKYGQVFEGRFGGITKAVEGSHTGGFNANTWGVAMLGNFDLVPPTPIQLRTVGRLIGWKLDMDGVNPLGTVTLRSAGSDYTFVPAGATVTLPTIFTHRDVGNTDCPGNAAYAAMPQLRDYAARFNDPPGPQDLVDNLRGGAIYDRWAGAGGLDSPLGAPTSPESTGSDGTRYATFVNGAVYWSPSSGAEPITGAIYHAWGALGFERSPLGLPTSGEIQEPEWIVQNFQHGTLNFDRESGAVTRVIDGVANELPPSGSPVQLERFSDPINP